MWVPTLLPGDIAPSSSARLTAVCTHLHAVTLCTSISLPSLTFPYESAILKAAASSGWTGTTLARLPLPDRTLSVGLFASSDRFETSRASASDTRSPARHCSREPLNKF